MLVALLAAGKLYGGAIESYQLVMPIVLVALYAMRAYRVYTGDLRSARNLAWLHALGAIVAVVNIVQFNTPIITVLYGIKVVVHVVGGVPAFLLSRSAR